MCCSVLDATHWLSVGAEKEEGREGGGLEASAIATHHALSSPTLTPPLYTHRQTRAKDDKGAAAGGQGQAKITAASPSLPPPRPTTSPPLLAPLMMMPGRHPSTTRAPCLLLYLVVVLLVLLLLGLLPTTHAAVEGAGNGGRRIVEVYHPFPFTPEGLIRQLIHAQQAVNKGSLSMALAAKDGIVLIGERRDLSPLVVGPTPKIGRLDQHVAYVMTGLVSDGRYLVRRGRALAQKHWFEYGEEVGLPALLMELSKVVTSAHYRAPPEGKGGGGDGNKRSSSFFEEIRSRPSVDPIGDAEAEVRKEGLPARHFGVGFLFAGPELACEAPALLQPFVEGGREGGKEEGREGGVYPPWVVYEMGPSGLFVRWSARAIGEGGEQAEVLLETKYRPEMTLEECKRLAIQVCDSVLTVSSNERQEQQQQHLVENLEMACLTRDGQGRPCLQRLSDEEVRQLRGRVSETMGLVDVSSSSSSSSS